MTAAKAEKTPRELVNAVAAQYGLTLQAVFVPLSASRNAKPEKAGEKPWQSLNWKISLQRNGAEVLATDYAQGSGHAPASKLKWQADRPSQRAKAAVVAAECETGKIHRYSDALGMVRTARDVPPPELADVLYSLSSDSDVLNYGGFESWAESFGYDTDSRSAEATYRACLETALKMRGAIGEAGLEALAVACQDF